MRRPPSSVFNALLPAGGASPPLQFVWYDPSRQSFLSLSLFPITFNIVMMMPPTNTASQLFDQSPASVPQTIITATETIAMIGISFLVST